MGVPSGQGEEVRGRDPERLGEADHGFVVGRAEVAFARLEQRDERFANSGARRELLLCETGNLTHSAEVHS